MRVFRPLNRQFGERLKSVFLQTMQNPGSDGSTTQKRSSAELAEKIAGLWVNAKLFEKGFKLFDGKTTVLSKRCCGISVKRSLCLESNVIFSNLFPSSHFLLSVQCPLYDNLTRRLAAASRSYVSIHVTENFVARWPSG